MHIVADPVGAYLQNSLTKAGGSSEHILQTKLQASAKRALLTRVEFEPAESEHNHLLQSLQSKYIVLGERDFGPVNAPNGGKPAASPSRPAGDAPQQAGSTRPQPAVRLSQKARLRLGWGNNSAAYPVGAGMVNMGNTCYLNSSLQALFHCPALVRWLLEDSQHATRCGQSGHGADQCLVCCVAKTLRITHQKHGPMKPMILYSKLKLICKHLIHGRQEDAHEFLRHLLDSMQRCHLLALRATKLDSLSKETTPINHLFGGYLKTQVTCLRCQHASRTYQHFQDIPVDIRQVSSLEDALHLYFKKERLDGAEYKCEKCRMKVPATKKFHIDEAPLILCLHLKRFSLGGGKITKQLSFPNKLNIARFMAHPPAQGQVVYSLVSLVNHMGPSQNCGHYTAMAKAANGQVYLFDDASVRMTSLGNMLNTNAYVLFYEMTPASRQLLHGAPPPGAAGDAAPSPAKSAPVAPSPAKSAPAAPSPAKSAPVARTIGPVSLAAKSTTNVVKACAPLDTANRPKISFMVSPHQQTSVPGVVLKRPLPGNRSAVLGRTAAPLVPYGGDSGEEEDTGVVETPAKKSKSVIEVKSSTEEKSNKAGARIGEGKENETGKISEGSQAMEHKHKFFKSKVAGTNAIKQLESPKLQNSQDSSQTAISTEKESAKTLLGPHKPLDKASHTQVPGADAENSTKKPPTSSLAAGLAPLPANTHGHTAAGSEPKLQQRAPGPALGELRVDVNGDEAAAAAAPRATSPWLVTEQVASPSLQARVPLVVATPMRHPWRVTPLPASSPLSDTTSDRPPGHSPHAAARAASVEPTAAPRHLLGRLSRKMRRLSQRSAPPAAAEKRPASAEPPPAGKRSRLAAGAQLQLGGRHVGRSTFFDAAPTECPDVKTATLAQKSPDKFPSKSPSSQPMSANSPVQHPKSSNSGAQSSDRKLTSGSHTGAGSPGAAGAAADRRRSTSGDERDGDLKQTPSSQEEAGSPDIRRVVKKFDRKITGFLGADIRAAATEAAGQDGVENSVKRLDASVRNESDGGGPDGAATSRSFSTAGHRKERHYRQRSRDSNSEDSPERSTAAPPLGAAANYSAGGADVMAFLKKGGGLTGYGSEVTTWTGETPRLERERETEEQWRQRERDEYNDELDAGRTKKVRHRSPRPSLEHNPFQRYQDDRRKSPKTYSRHSSHGRHQSDRDSSYSRHQGDRDSSYSRHQGDRDRHRRSYGAAHSRYERERGYSHGRNSGGWRERVSR